MKILYIGRFNLPQDAASLRVYHIGRALKIKGHQVDYLCQDGFIHNNREMLDGSVYYGVYNSKSGRVKRYADWMFGSRTVYALKKILDKENYDAIVLYNVSSALCSRVMKICRPKTIAVVQDVTEWYEIGHGRGIFASLYAILVDRRIRLYDKKSSGVIAISRYLSDYYKDKVKTIRIPPIFSGNALQNQSANEGCPKFIYAGSPGKKDELNLFLEAIKTINQNSIRAYMTLIGAPIPLDCKSQQLKGIVYFPRMTNKEVIEKIGQHDFTVLLRRNKQFSKAGYSTKIAESLFNGTPVFCNEIGGADLDVVEGKTGVKIKSLDIEVIISALNEIIEMSPQKITEMKVKSYSFGKSEYAAESYADCLDAFFLDCVNNRKSRNE